MFGISRHAVFITAVQHFTAGRLLAMAGLASAPKVCRVERRASVFNGREVVDFSGRPLAVGRAIFAQGIFTQLARAYSLPAGGVVYIAVLAHISCLTVADLRR